MGLRKYVSLVALGAGLCTCAWLSLVVVDETQFVLVTDFGRPVAVYGDDAGEAGLHAKWPWQSTVAIDRRLQLAEPPAREVITGDKRNLDVAPFFLWRVADAVRFVRSAGSLDTAEARLDERLAAALSEAIGQVKAETLASTDPAVWNLDALLERIRDALAGPARQELGVELVDVRLRQFNPPLEVRPAIFDLIRSERRQVAATLRAEGEAEYLTITSAADRERDAILATGAAEAERIRGRGEAEATRILNAAHAQDPRFYEFLRTLEAFRSILDERTTVVLSASSPLLRLLVQGPSPDLLKEPRSAPAPSESPAGSQTTNPVAGSPEAPR
jgi:membrane protease subunit HflC